MNAYGWAFFRYFLRNGMSMALILISIEPLIYLDFGLFILEIYVFERVMEVIRPMRTALAL
jgi:hypothetical protein